MGRTASPGLRRMLRCRIGGAAIALTLLAGSDGSRLHAAQQSAPTSSDPPSATASSTPSSQQGDADAGRQAFASNGCYACHGREGQGSPNTGPRLGPNPLPAAAFTAYIRAPRGQMPPYTEKVLSEAVVADIIAFLQTRPRPASIDNLVPKYLQVDP